jgi:hypothetical protein
MKAAILVFVLAVPGVVMHAQSETTPTADVTIGISEGTPEYCLGEFTSPLFEGSKRGPDDITLRLPLSVSYENHRSETIILPSWTHYVARMTVTGQSGSTIVRNVGNGAMDVKRVMAMSSPDRVFTIIDGGKYAWSTAPEGVVIPVLDRSSGLDLRGKTIQIVITRDFGALAPDVVEKLNEKWKDFGTLWTGVAESEPVTFQIPQEPLTRNCVTLVAR